MGANHRAAWTLRTLTAIVVAAALAAPGRARGDVDLTGDWFFVAQACVGTFCFDLMSGPMPVVQSGSTITLTPFGVTYTGTIETIGTSGLSFRVSAPGCGPTDDFLQG